MNLAYRVSNLALGGETGRLHVLLRVSVHQNTIHARLTYRTSARHWERTSAGNCEDGQDYPAAVEGESDSQSYLLGGYRA